MMYLLLVKLLKLLIVPWGIEIYSESEPGAGAGLLIVPWGIEIKYGQYQLDRARDF